MDPVNNPTPTPNPVNPEPAPEPPVAPAESPEAPVPPVEPVSVPVEPIAPTGPTTPVEPVAPNPEPVNPVINPGANPEPVNPVFQPGGQGGLSATDPIMQPEAPKAPDPVEEELKAPMEPAGPVPGSIGSAVSGPAGAPAEASAENPFATAPQGQTPNVSFTDPAAQPENPVAMGVADPKAKSKKTTLIVLIAVAAVIVVVLVVVLVMSLMPQGSSSSSQANNSSNSSVVEPEDDEEEEDTTPTTDNGTLGCTRNMTPEELVSVNDATSGAINISAEFQGGVLESISRVDSVVYSDEDSTATEPVENEVHEAKAADLTSSSAMNYFLSPNADGDFELTMDEVQSNYENLDFTCEVL